MIEFRLMALLCAVALLPACASTDAGGNTAAHNPDGCRKVHIAGTRFPKTICGTGSQGLTEVEKDRLRDAIGRPIVTEQN